LSESERLTRSVLDAVRDYAIVTLDLDGRVIGWSAGAERLTGYDEEEILGQTYEKLFPSDAAAEARQQLTIAARDGHAQGEGRRRRKDGSLFFAALTLDAWTDAAGALRGFVEVARDVTAQREAQLATERARDAAEAANRAKSEFLAIMSHEVRTPLNGIIGMNALLLASDLTDRQRKWAEATCESEQSLLAIVDDILDNSKLEAGRMEIEEDDFDLPRLIDAAVELLAPSACEKGILLLADVARVSRAALRGDALRLRQILLNLLSNAVKFTSSGSVAVAAFTQDEGFDRTRVRIEVRDDGPGVDRETQMRLFRPFEQADGSTPRRFGGTGLGLSISKRLVELMGGRIGMEERPEGGSLFWFEVPVSPACAASPSPEAAARDKPRFSGRILLAEDNRVNVEVTTLILESVGFAVDVAADGNKAIAALAQGRYDLVLMDMEMPWLDGVAATRAIRAAEQGRAHLPIVAMTANAMKEDRRRCLEAGMDDYVSKPFTPTALIENVARWIERSKKADFDPIDEASPVSHLPVIDEAAAEAFRSVAPRGKFIELLGRYLETLDRLPDSLTKLKAPLAIEEIGKEAHRLIMGSGTFGARQVQELALLLQSACNKDDAASVATLSANLQSASAVASRALRSKYRLTSP
jgi:two-component system sensor histidine kinase/response regulator